MAAVDRKVVTTLARRLGFTVSTSSPGDGVRRYDLCKVTAKGGSLDRTCYGAREAWVFLVGYEAGRNDPWPKTDPTCVLCETGEEPGHEH